jgi:hypothetical protein
MTKRPIRRLQNLNVTLPPITGCSRVRSAKINIWLWVAGFPDLCIWNKQETLLRRKVLCYKQMFQKCNLRMIFPYLHRKIIFHILFLFLNVYFLWSLFLLLASFSLFWTNVVPLGTTRGVLDLWFKRDLVGILDISKCNLLFAILRYIWCI